MRFSATRDGTYAASPVFGRCLPGIRMRPALFPSTEAPLHTVSLHALLHSPCVAVQPPPTRRHSVSSQSVRPAKIDERHSSKSSHGNPYSDALYPISAHDSSDIDPDSDNDALDACHRIHFRWLSALCLVAILLFLATLIGIHLDRPVVRAPHNFYNSSFFHAPYRHFLAFHSDTRTSEYWGYIHCSATETRDLFLGSWRENTGTTMHCDWDSEIDRCAECKNAAAVGGCLSPVNVPNAVYAADFPQRCKVSAEYSRHGTGEKSNKSISMGIVQHPALAIVGYGFGLGVLLISATILSMVFHTWIILVPAFITYAAMLLVMGYAEVSGTPHFIAAVVAISGCASTHGAVLYFLRKRTGGVFVFYIVLLVIMIVCAILLGAVVLVDNFSSTTRFVILEHICVGLEVIAFALTAWEIAWVYREFPVYVLTQTHGLKRTATWTAAQGAAKRKMRQMLRTRTVEETHQALLATQP